MFDRQKIEEMIVMRRYGSETLSVLLSLASMIGPGNMIPQFTQQELAGGLFMCQPQISRAIGKLVRDGIIAKDGRNFRFSDDFWIERVKPCPRSKDEVLAKIRRKRDGTVFIEILGRGVFSRIENAAVLGEILADAQVLFDLDF